VAPWAPELAVDIERLRRLDLFWLEKMWTILDFLQIYGLLWLQSQPWPWPRPWLRQTRWTLLANLDFMGLSAGGAPMTITGNITSPWGTYEGYLRYTWLFSLGTIALGTMWLKQRVLLDLWEAFLKRGGKRALILDLNEAQAMIERIILFAAHIIFLPATLAISRLVICNADGKLEVDLSRACGSAPHSFAVILGLVSLVPFTIFLFWHSRVAAVELTVYNYGPDHERMVQGVEIEYALRLSNDWEVEQAWLASSFRRHALQYRALMLLQKLVLLIIYSFFRSSQRMQALLFCAVVMGWTAWTCALPPYRCLSSNQVHLSLQLALWADTFLGMLTGYRVRSAALVASNQRWLLTLINTIAL
ncbi:unnamed protein product, partial [Discosporangium mesarthrocarpum]